MRPMIAALTLVASVLVALPVAAQTFYLVDSEFDVEPLTSEDLPALSRSDGLPVDLAPSAVTIVTAPTLGTAEVVPNPQAEYAPLLRYTHTGAEGVDRVDLQVCVEDECHTMTVKIRTLDGNVIARNDDYDMVDGDRVGPNWGYVHDNDIDAQRFSNVPSVVAPPTFGTASFLNIEGEGVLQFDPGSQVGVATLSYETCNTIGCDTAVVTITVSHSAGSDCTIVGTAGDDVLVGTNDTDVICGLGGNDTIEGRGGDDILRGGDGEDIIYGNPGNDTIDGDDGEDTIYGGSGNDLIRGGAGIDILNGGPGGDYILGGDDADELYGGNDDDELYGGNGNDLVVGNDGNDSIHGEAGADVIEGDVGNDTMLGGPDDDVILGGAGDDGMNGQAGNDELRGGPGNDGLTGSDGDDLLFGGNDNDTLDGGAGMDTTNGGSGTDSCSGETVTNCETTGPA